MSGLDFLGMTLPTLGWSPSARYIPRQSVDVFMAPSMVQVDPHNGASIVFNGVAQVTVEGGTAWIPPWSAANTDYDSPALVTVTLNDGTVQGFPGLQSASVHGGVKQSTTASKPKRPWKPRRLAVRT